MRRLDLSDELAERGDPTCRPCRSRRVAERHVRVDALEAQTRFGHDCGDECCGLIEAHAEAAEAGVDLDMHGDGLLAGRGGSGLETGAIGDGRRQVMGEQPRRCCR